MNGIDRTRAKPAGSQWTDEQWAAVAAGGSHLLVAAAAGSGKTAVLVERIISRIADEERPLDVDALLVATFTKAAAAEMKERIRRALEDALEAKPHSQHLRRQLALLSRASITTLHSFCLEVIEKDAPLIGLDPGFRIASETETELLRIDTLDELFEERYEAEGESGTLAGLAERFGGERSDEPLHRLVLELYEFARSHPWPAHWLRETAGRFADADAARLADSPWVRSMREDALLTLGGALELLAAARALVRRPGGPLPYDDTLAEDERMLAGLREIVAAQPWGEWQGAFAGCVFGRMKPCRGDGYDAGLQERVKALRDEAKAAVQKLAAEWFVRTPAQYAEELRRLAPDMAALAELVVAFGDRYEAAKREKGLLDFGDLEHYALRILRDPASTPERTVPSAAALAYRDRFEEILLDEYQDTNEVQEAIVSLIARDNPGNVFMVGDVKQSIYRFRLAEPGLFLGKYKTYGVWTREEGASGGVRDGGMRIDLARNFRSRPRVVDAVNHVFRLIMRESVAEMDYDRRAELIYGEGYPPEPQAEDPAGPYAVEMVLLDRGASAAGEADEGAGGDESEAAGAAEAEEEEEAETMQLEARCIAEEIHRLTGRRSEEALPVYDARARLYRPLAYRDIVILLRAATSLAPVVLEELKAAGIPAYADLATGYFAATEVDVVLSLLHVIDNPDQDIPLAGVLRSPIVGLSAEQLALVRVAGGSGSYWQAVRAAARPDEAAPGAADEGLRRQLGAFLDALERWRTFARREPLGELLLLLYRETGYYDFVGGLPGGGQRQANLRALVDRARQYERTALSRGLYRFLRFLERMRDTGADLGAARALGEQEDVVRIVSIHKSKGLEFPVVFVAGLGRSFNRQDLNGLFLKHKTLGFGPKLVEPDTRVAYPTLPQLAIRRKMRAELLAEEMRVLYVALTRPKEKLILVGTSRDAEKDWARWREAAEGCVADGEAAAADDTGKPRGLSDHVISSAQRFLDWLGPAAAAAEGRWRIRTVQASVYARGRVSAEPDEAAGTDAVWQAAAQLQPVPVEETEAGRAAYRALEAVYPHEEAARVAAKTSITALKRQGDGLAAPEEADAEEVRTAAGRGEPAEGLLTFRLRRPRFATGRRLTPAERGTAYHLVMQHLPLTGDLETADIERLIGRLEDARILSAAQREAVLAERIAAFCKSELYRRLCASPRVWRELPFSYGLPASRVYPDRFAAGTDETVLIQGVVDCLFAEDDGLVLIDYKTDERRGRSWEAVAETHRFQVEQYAEAVGRILNRPVKESYVYFVEEGQAVRLS